MRVRSAMMIGSGVTTRKCSQGGVIASRFVASEKNANTCSRGRAISCDDSSVKIFIGFGARCVDTLARARQPALSRIAEVHQRVREGKEERLLEQVRDVESGGPRVD